MHVAHDEHSAGRAKWKSCNSSVTTARMLPRRTLFPFFLLFFAIPLRANPPALPAPGISYELEIQQDPPQRLHWLTIDLADPRWKTHVSPGGADPDGPGAWQTTLMRPSAVAARDRLDIAVNGDFFSVKRDPIAPNYRTDQWASVAGPAMSAGRAWSTSAQKRPCLVVRADGRLRIETHDAPTADAAAVVAGNVMLLKDGKAPAFENIARHPRTVVALDKDARRLTLLIVEGRTKSASGMSYAELAAALLKRNCHTALNLDGGGSSSLVVRDPISNEHKVFNTLSDGRERPVANVLGLRYE